MITQSTRYEITVKGTLHEEAGVDYIHTYKVDKKPQSMDELRKIAGDFQDIKEIIPTEVTTVVKRSILKIK